mgnify:CR=1 FL=1
MRLFVTRHGETDYNHNEIILGTTDVPLNAAGLAQAEGLRETLSGAADIDVVICSPMVRTRQTAAALGIPQERIVYDERLRE